MSNKNILKTELVFEADAQLHESLQGEIERGDPSQAEAQRIIENATIGRRAGPSCGKDSPATG